MKSLSVGLPVLSSTEFPLLSNRSGPLACLDEESALGIRRIGKYQVGLGAYSDVWKAEMTLDGMALTVALKVLRRNVPQARLHKREEREKIWSSLHHDNIALLFAIYRQPNGSPVFVSQWYENGTADEYLRRHPTVNPVKIICDIAAGIEYLHGRDVVHGDLKASNVLIDDRGRARLIDFGLSRLMGSELDLETATTTTLRWCAPELLNSDDAYPTMSSDVYGFASTTLELLSGNIPYHTLGDRTVPFHILNGATPRAFTTGFRSDVSCSLELWDLLEQCWAKSSDRPSINEVRLRLSDLYL